MKQRILVIDDDPSLRRVMEYNLQQEGYEVSVAASGEKGLGMFDQLMPALVITDMKMPGIDGLDVLRHIRQRSPETLVIIITAFGEVDRAVEAMKAGAYDYIQKPFSRDSLKLTVSKALQYSGVIEENRRLKSQLDEKAGFRNMIGTSNEMQKVFDVINKVADTEAAVLITGESGTGKELVARAIHAQSSRRNAPFVAINCSAIPRELIESELFGYAKGAFTGALKDKAGKFQLAEGGTLFLDEIGELLPELQPKLLRALQEKEIDPVGSDKPLKIDVRVLSATNLDIRKAVTGGSFREDLFYRLSVIEIHLPPLRERRDDIALLIRHFCEKHGSAEVQFSRDALEVMKHHPWPGNIRELENTVERILILRHSDSIGVSDLPENMLQKKTEANNMINLPDEGYPLDDLEKNIIIHALEKNSWNQAAAARFLSIPRHVLIYRIEKYGITLP
ncbi:MAG: sigma-54-dependent Fis family transcriptional regulator [Chlorobium sp.]|nr:MAG: sigma-54-dependent Fis family transcriptional regulator [Chlorobium sp.]